MNLSASILKAPPLHFVIIGAQKAGTTTLHEVLSSHPMLAMPAGKERPYFSEVNSGSWDQFVASAYNQDIEGTLLGKSTPQYLNTPGTAGRIYAANPEVRIIVILRNPSERTYSHFRMCLRRGQLDSDFDKHVRAWLKPDALANARMLPHTRESEAHCCVVWSEYSRMLNTYLETFPNSSILVTFTEQLAENPHDTFKAILQHLGLDDHWESELINRQFHVGGSQRRIALPKSLKSIPGVRPLVKLAFKALPNDLAYRYMMWNIKPNRGSLAEDFPAAKAALDAHFSDQARWIMSHFGVTPPW